MIDKQCLMIKSKMSIIRSSKSWKECTYKSNSVTMNQEVDFSIVILNGSAEFMKKPNSAAIKVNILLIN